MDRLSHFDDEGNAAMVDVTAKDVTRRTARARALVRLDVAPTPAAVAAACAAGERAGTATSQLVPLCHPLPGTTFAVGVEFDDATGVAAVVAEASVAAETGVEMEALTAAGAAALALGASVEELALEEKRGGRSGTWVRPSGGATATR